LLALKFRRCLSVKIDGRALLKKQKIKEAKEAKIGKKARNDY
jgi:hypothetical protein